MNELQDKIWRTHRGQPLDLGGRDYVVNTTVYIDEAIRLTNGAIYVHDYKRENFHPPNGDEEILAIRSSDVELDGISIYGPGATGDHLSGIKVLGASSVRIERCKVYNVEYALVDVQQSSSVRIEKCTLFQDPAIYTPDTWCGLNYGVMVYDSRDVVISHSKITGTRHAANFGMQAVGCYAENCELLAYADVQTAITKEASRDCGFIHNRIYGGIVTGGDLSYWRNNRVYGRGTYDHHPRPANPKHDKQPSTACYLSPNVTRSMSHDVSDNTFFVHGLPGGSRDRGGVCIHNTKNGTYKFTNNRMVLVSGEMLAQMVNVVGHEGTVIDEGTVVE